MNSLQHPVGDHKTENKQEHENGQKQKEKEFSNIGGCSSDTGESQNRGNNRDDKKNGCPP